MGLFLLSVAVIGAAMSIMAVGVLLSNRCLRGSCGGPTAAGPDGEPLSCAACPNRQAVATGGHPSGDGGAA